MRDVGDFVRSHKSDFGRAQTDHLPPVAIPSVTTRRAQRFLTLPYFCKKLEIRAKADLILLRASQTPYGQTLQ